MTAVTEAVKKGDSEAFFKAMKENPQYAAFTQARDKALESGDTNLKTWAEKATIAMKKSFEAEHLEMTGSKGFSFENMLSGDFDFGKLFKQVIEGFKKIMTGDFSNGLNALIKPFSSAFNNAADPQKIKTLDQQRDAALQDAKKALEASGSKEIGQDVAQKAATQIDAIKPG